MSRAEARINLILDEVVRSLRTIDGSPELWLTNPRKVVRFTAKPASEPMPLLIVKCVRWGPNEPQTGSQHDAQAVIEVTVYTKFGAQVDDPDRELHRACADVVSAVESNWELRDATGEKVVPGLQIHVIEGYEPAEANVAATNGLAVAVVGFRAFWPWTAATP